jgi:serine/alanine adding enzyme
MVKTLSTSELVNINETDIHKFYSKVGTVTYLQSWPYIRLKLKENQSHELIISYDGNNEIVGLLFGELQKQYYGPLSFITSRMVVEGGPLVCENNIEVADNLLKELVNTASKKSVYILIRNYYDRSDIFNTFYRYNFSFEPHLNILIDLNKSEEKLWNEVHTKRRNGIRRARKEKVNIVLRKDSVALMEGYRILISVYKRAGLPLPSKDYFLSVLDNSNNSHGLRIFCAIYGSQIIGVMFALCYEDTIYDWYAGADKIYYNKCPNDLIPWEVIVWGKNNGYRLFDFGGAGKPGIPYGVRDYKQKFGGQLVNYGRFIRINNSVLYTFGKYGLRIFKIVKSIL